MTGFLHDTVTVAVRELMPTLRAPMGIVLSMAQPLLFLFFFGPLLAGVGGASWQWFVPGVLVMMCLFGPMMSGYTVLVELMGGSWERILVTPLSRTAILVGRTCKEFAVLGVQAALLIGLAIPLGFRPDPIGVLAGTALLLVFAVGLCSLSFALAIASQPSGERFYLITQVLLFPLLLLSDVLLPVEFGPGWLRLVADLNPVSHIADAERALFSGQDVAAAPVGVLWAVAIAAVGVAIGRAAMRRAT